MELGQRLRQARLDAGLSQRQLCADLITRNMLSQIENGSARPSMDTLRQLAARLGKSVGYFLEDDAIVSSNAQLMEQLRSAPAVQVPELLKQYRSPDPVFDRERYLLEALCCMTLAEQAMADNRQGLAASWLRRAAQAGEMTPYYTPELEQRRILLCHRAGMDSAASLSALLPDQTDMLLLLAEGALEEGLCDRAQGLLAAAAIDDRRWHSLQAALFFAQGQYAQAAEHYLCCEPTQKVYAQLEECYKQLRDFEKAYYYACKQR